MAVSKVLFSFLSVASKLAPLLMSSLQTYKNVKSSDKDGTVYNRLIDSSSPGFFTSVIMRANLSILVCAPYFFPPARIYEQGGEGSDLHGLSCKSRFPLLEL